MDFNRTAEQKELGALARKVFSTIDEARLKAVERADWFDEVLWSQLAQSGLLGAAIPEEHGGAGFGFVEACVVCEEAGRAVAPGPLVNTIGVALAVARFGSPALRARVLPRIVTGESTYSTGMTEADGGDPRRPGASAVADGGGYRLSGEKVAVAHAARAAGILVAARVAGSEGVGLFLLNPRAEGVTLERQISTSGEPLSRMTLTSARVAAEDVIGVGALGTTALDWVVARVTALLCAMEVGIARRQLELTADYALRRQQFGKPIGLFQAVAQRAADAYIDVESISLATWQAAYLLGEDSDERKAGRAVAVAKYWAAEAGARVGQAAQHIHAGMGFDKGYPLYRYFLRAKEIENTLGGAGAQLAIIGEALRTPRA